jgi:hypothetical protein
MAERREDLPAPDFPIMQTNLPLGIFTEISLRQTIFSSFLD